MNWFSIDINEDVVPGLDIEQPEDLSKILVQGSTGMGKEDFLTRYLEGSGHSLTVLCWVDFSRFSYSSSLIVSHSISHFIAKQNYLKSFLHNFSAGHQEYIRQMLAKCPERCTEYLDWYTQIFIEYARFISQTSIPVIILENIDQLDSVQFERLQQFIRNFIGIPLQIFYLVDPSGQFKHDVKAQQEFKLVKLSIHQAERTIREYFDTSMVNARLITNHSYLKTSGNPLRLRYILESYYGLLLKHGQQEPLNVKKMQQMRLPETWEEIFSTVYRQFDKNEAQVFAFLAHLGDPMHGDDFRLLLKKRKIPQKKIPLWLRSGFLRSIIHYGDPCFSIYLSAFQRWIKNSVSLEELAGLIREFNKIAQSGRFQSTYQLSDLLYDIEEGAASLRSAVYEGESFRKLGQPERAVDRLYFALRVSESESLPLENFEQILDTLGGLYLHLGYFENAFEILKKLRIYYLKNKNDIEQTLKIQWLEVNLKMAEALVEMDSFQEARYLIRETRVKEFCDDQTIGRCFDLLGDIESNLAHPDLAWKQYSQSLEYYTHAQDVPNLVQLYRKLKAHLSEDIDQHLKLTKEILGTIMEEKEIGDFRSILLRDRIQLLLRKEEYKAALAHSLELWHILMTVYQPRLKVQLAFYFGEIYSRMGKWDLALSHLKKLNSDLYVIHRPELHIQSLIQLGMIYKEQALYGDAQKILEEGMQICFRHGFHEQMNEIKLHLGHIYLLVHGLLRAHETLNEVVEWSAKNQKLNIQFLARLYLAYYEIQHGRFEKARMMLSRVKKLLNMSNNLIDYLNYLFYLTIWALETERYSRAGKIIEVLQQKSRNYPRYQAAGYFLSGRYLHLTGNFQDAEKALSKALAISNKGNFPYIRYLTLCERARMSLHLDSPKSITHRFRQACDHILELSRRIDDRILGTQFLESGFHEDILEYCRANKILRGKETNND